MEGSNRSGLQCYEHPNQQITNYCLHFDCLRPLCPDCVQTHTKFHQKQQIQSWKHCVNKSARNVKNTLDALHSIYDKQHQHQSIKSVQMIESENVRRLHQIKERVLKMVEDTFNSHEQRLRNLIRSQYKIDPPDTTKLKMAIEELQKILMKLGHTTTVLPALKKSLLLDHESLLGYFGNMKLEKRTTLNENYITDSHDVSRIRQVLEDSVRFNTMNMDYGETDGYTSPNRSARGQHPYEPSHQNRNTTNAIVINQPNYFDDRCGHKNLHFFIPSSKQLKILNIDQAISGGTWKSTVFKAKSDLTCFFQSIVTPTGDIYLSGGSEDNKRLRQIYKYSYEKNSLQFVCKMNKGRSSHSICYLNNSIYFIGGFSGEQSQISRSCEVLRLNTLNCESIAPLNAPSANSCAVAFNNNYILNIGGILNRVDSNNLIQIYNARENVWSIVNLEYANNTPRIQFLSFSAGVQINQRQILVFGGYDNTQAQRPQRTSFIIEVDPSRSSAIIKNYNQFPLPHAEGFWNNHPIVHNGKIYSLQNVTDRHDELTAVADERRLVIFNGEKWL